MDVDSRATIALRTAKRLQKTSHTALQPHHLPHVLHVRAIVGNYGVVIFLEIELRAVLLIRLSAERDARSRANGTSTVLSLTLPSAIRMLVWCIFPFETVIL